MRIEIHKLKLPKISHIGIQVLEALSKEDFNLNDVAELVLQDPALTGILIKYANSPLYRRYVEITNVRKAINLLGMKNVKLTVTVAAMRAFTMVPCKAIETFWEHSFNISVACKLIGTKVNRALADDFEFTGIIHDLGPLTIAANYPREYDALLAKAEAEDMPVNVMEEKLFEFSRAEFIDWAETNLHLPPTSMQALKLFDGIELPAAKREAQLHHAVLSLAHILDNEISVAAGQSLLQVVRGKKSDLCAQAGLAPEVWEEIKTEYQKVRDERFQP